MIDPQEAKANYKCKQRVTSLLMEMIGQEGVKNPHLFTNAWTELVTDAELMRTLSGLKSDIQLNLKERLHFLIMRTMYDLGVDCVPKITVHGDEHFQSAIQAKKSSLFLTIHDGFAFLSAIFLHYGQRTSIITSAPKIGDTLWRTGVRPDQVELITKDFRSLGRLKTSMDRGVIPCNCVDYENENGVYEWINPALFDFAIKKKLSLFFQKREIGDDGVANIYTAALNSTSDPIEDAQLFANFQMSTTYSPYRKYTVKQ